MSTVNTTNLKNPSSGSNNVELNADGTTTLTPSNIIKSGTAVASTSGTSIDFTGIPSWVKRVTVMFNGVSTNGSSIVLLQLGAGSIETSGYLGTGATFGTGVVNTNFTAGFGSGATGNTAAVTVRHGSFVLSALGSNAWACIGSVGDSGGASTHTTQGSKTLSGTLDRIRITTVNGTDTFDAGTVNILYEG